MTNACVIKTWDSKVTCVRSKVVPDSHLTVATMEAVTERPSSANAILPGQVLHATFPTVLVHLTAMPMAHVLHPQQTMTHQNAIAQKDGWA